MKLIVAFLIMVSAKEKKKHKKGFSRPRINLEPHDQIAKWDETSEYFLH